MKHFISHSGRMRATEGTFATIYAIGLVYSVKVVFGCGSLANGFSHIRANNFVIYTECFAFTQKMNCFSSGRFPSIPWMFMRITLSFSFSQSINMINIHFRKIICTCDYIRVYFWPSLCQRQNQGPTRTPPATSFASNEWLPNQFIRIETRRFTCKP